MAIQITGKNVPTGEAYQSYVAEKIRHITEKYIGPEISAHVRVEKVRSVFRTSCSMRLRTGLLLECEGEGGDAYASADAAIEHLEKRVRRYKRRLKNHHDGHNGVHGVTALSAETARDAVVRLDDEDVPDVDVVPPGPAVIAETTRIIAAMTVGEAVMRLDLTREPLLVFRSAASGRMNVVYRRDDGNIGWIDPGGGTTAT